MSNLLLEKLTDFIVGTHYEDIPQKLIDLTKLAIIDTVGVTIAGWNEPAVEGVKKVYLHSGSPFGSSSLWGQCLKVPVETAALINGTASHVLDFDDAAPSVIIHPSAPVLSAAIPVAEQLNKSGKDVITAYVIGTEVMLQLGKIVDLKHYQLGWHSTATLGTIGAAAACSYLYDLTKEQAKHAIAIACSMAGGLQKNFGTMTKSFHVGLAASQGVQAAALAKNGFTGNHDIFGTRGFLHAFNGGDNVETLVEKATFGKNYELLKTGLTVKKFPCCYATHRFIHGVLALITVHHLQLEDIQEITLVAPPGGLMPLVSTNPLTGLEGKFSAAYTALTALKDGYVKLSSFENEQVLRPEIQGKMATVDVRQMPGVTKTSQEIEEIPVEITIKTIAGNVYEKKVLHAPGSQNSPLTDKEMRDKWQDCLSQYNKATNNRTERLVENCNIYYDEALQIEKIDNFGNWLANMQVNFEQLIKI
ncbi:MAG: MmgE/PrpD family protein [Solibacillus sp.]